MVSSENPEGVTSMITGREWNTVCGSSLLLQEHPELLITEIDMEEDRDREIYINIMREQKARDDENNASITTVPSTSSSSSSSSSSSVSILGAEIENVLKSNDINDNPEENQMDAVDKDNSENQSNNNIMIDNKINIDQLSLNSTSTSTSIRNMKSEVENNHDDHNSLKINLKSSSHPESLERSSATVVKINDIMSSSKVAIGKDQRSRKTSEEDEEQGEEGEGDDDDEEDDDDGEEEVLEEGMGIAVDSVGVNIGTDAEEMTRKAFEEAFNNESDDDDDDDDDEEEEEGGGEEEGKEDNNGNESENEGENSESGNIMIETPKGSLLGNKQIPDEIAEEEEEEEEDIDNDGEEEEEEEEEEEVEEEGNEIGSKNFEMITDTNLDKAEAEAEAEAEAGAIEEATGDEEREEEDEDEDDDDWMNVV